MIWRRQWHPTPVLLPGKSHGRRSLVGCSPWVHEESDTYWATSLSLFTFMHWRRKWQPTPVFLPGESQRQGSLVGCRLWGRTESAWLKQLSSSSSSSSSIAYDQLKKEYHFFSQCIFTCWTHHKISIEHIWCKDHLSLLDPEKAQ